MASILGSEAREQRGSWLMLALEVVETALMVEPPLACRRMRRDFLVCRTGRGRSSSSSMLLPRDERKQLRGMVVDVLLIARR